MLTITDKSKEIVSSYFNLNLGGKIVPSPYYINTHKRKAELRALIGKGTAEEIIEETLIYAKIKGFNLKESDPFKIRSFMEKIGIGIDCSGFVGYILGSHINLKSLKFRQNSLYLSILRTIRFIQNISADDLTSELNTEIVTDLNNVKPYDLIRSHAVIEGGMHVAIITEVNTSEDGKVLDFKYVHSTRWYEEFNGVREGKIVVTNPLLDLSNQEWIDEVRGRNYFKEEFMTNISDSGVRHLKCIK